MVKGFNVLVEKNTLMARVTKNGIEGMVGNYVFYTMNGKAYVRARPAKRAKKKNQPANPVTSIFGTVSKYGTAMIKEMSKSFPIPFTRDVYNRLRGWMRNEYAANGSTPEWKLEHNNNICSFDIEADLRDYWRKNLTVTDKGNGKIQLEIPEFNPLKDIKVPGRTMKVNLKLIAITSPFKGDPKACSSCTTQFSFDYSSNPVPANTFALQTTAGTGDIALVVMSLEFYTSGEKDSLVKDKKWMPAAVMAFGRLK